MTKEIVISFKTIFINTFNVMLMDISQDKAQSIIFRHEGFQLWESASSGFLLEKTKDYIIINNLGIQIVALGSKSLKPIVRADGSECMIHSLDSCSYLKIDKGNSMVFAC